MSSPLETKVLEIITKLEAAAPKATALGLEAIRVKAIGELIGAVIALVAAVLLYWLGRSLWQKPKEDDFYGDETGWQVGAILSWITAGMCAMATIVILLSVELWAALLRPELYLAMKLVP